MINLKNNQWKIIRKLLSVVISSIMLTVSLFPVMADSTVVVKVFVEKKDSSTLTMSIVFSENINTEYLGVSLIPNFKNCNIDTEKLIQGNNGIYFFPEYSNQSPTFNFNKYRINYEVEEDTVNDISFDIPLKDVNNNAEVSFTITYDDGDAGFKCETDAESVLYVQLNSSGTDPSATITADTSSVSSVSPGENFTVPVKITNNPGFTGFSLTPVYDSNSIEYVSYTKGDYNGMYVVNPTTGVANYSSADTETDETGDGTLITYTFRVNDKAEAKSYDIGISCNDFSNAATENLSSGLTLTPGSVTVEAVPAGYSVDVSAKSDTVEQNQIAKINLDITNPDVQIYNDTQLKLTYDSTNFEFVQNDSTIPGTFVVDANTTNSPATLTIKGYGENLDLQEDSNELVLAFKAIGNARSTGDFQLTTAKIDQASHANENVVDATYPENPVTVTIEEAVPETELKVETSDYVIAERIGEYTLIKATVVNPVEGQIPTYNGEAMFKMTNVGSEKTYDEDAYYYVVKAADYNKNLVILDEQSEVIIDKANLADPNCTGVTDINDAQFVYNLYNTETISVSYPVSAKQLLASDVNGDGSIQTSDCAAVIARL